MFSFGLVQHVENPTRVVPGKSSTLIDHIYSNSSGNIQFIDVPQIGISDHYPIFFSRKVNAQAQKMSHNTIKYRSFKNFDEQQFKADLNSAPWDVVKVF